MNKQVGFYIQKSNDNLMTNDENDGKKLTWTSLNNESRTLSLMTTGPMFWLGVSDADGVGGGKGWSNGVPYGRCRVTGG